MRCSHIVECCEAYDVDEEGAGFFFPVWACEKCGKEFRGDEIGKFLNAGSGTIH